MKSNDIISYFPTSCTGSYFYYPTTKIVVTTSNNTQWAWTGAYTSSTTTLTTAYTPWSTTYKIPEEDLGPIIE